MSRCFTTMENAFISPIISNLLVMFMHPKWQNNLRSVYSYSLSHNLHSETYYINFSLVIFFWNTYLSKRSRFCMLHSSCGKREFFLRVSKEFLNRFRFQKVWLKLLFNYHVIFSWPCTYNHFENIKKNSLKISN